MQSVLYRTAIHSNVKHLFDGALAAPKTTFVAYTIAHTQFAPHT